MCMACKMLFLYDANKPATSGRCTENRPCQKHARSTSSDRHTGGVGGSNIQPWCVHPACPLRYISGQAGGAELRELLAHTESMETDQPCLSKTCLIADRALVE